MDVPIKLGTYYFNITLVLEVFQDDCFCCCEPAKLNNSLVILKEEQSSMFLSRKNIFSALWARVILYWDPDVQGLLFFIIQFSPIIFTSKNTFFDMLPVFACIWPFGD